MAQRVIDGARDRGLLLLKCGPHKNVVRLLPPLTASPEEITSGIERLEAAVLDAQISREFTPWRRSSERLGGLVALPALMNSCTRWRRSILRLRSF